MYQQNVPPPGDQPSNSTHPPTRSNVVELNHIRQRRQVRQLPQNNSVPVWLRSLVTMQRGAMLVFSSVFGLSLILYGYTVYTQDSWKQQHGQLKRLQIQERQQGVMNENLKHQMAQAAEQPQSGLVDPNPHQIVFIPSAPQRPTKSYPLAPQPKMAPKPKPPLGY